MVPRLVKKVFGFPFRLVRRALQLWTPSQPEILPVGGLTPEASSELLFALRQAATTAEVSQCGATPIWDGCSRCILSFLAIVSFSVACFTLESMQDERIVSDWLGALELSQVASDR